MKNRSILFLTSLLAVSACTTMNPVEMSPEDVQQKIVSENILQPGKRAKIVTQDGKIRSIKVKRVDKELNLIEADKETINIADIVAVETRDFSIGKTAMLAAGSYTILAILAAAVAPVFIL